MSDSRPVELLELQMDVLRRERNRAVTALERAALFTSFSLSLGKLESPLPILSETDAKLRSLIPFETVAFYLVNESDSSFSLAWIDPDGRREWLEQEVARLVDDQTFAWALGRSALVRLFATDGVTRLILHPLRTESRVRGMFVGVLPAGHSVVSDIDNALVSITLISCARAVESYELYRVLTQSRQDLERQVGERTSELTRTNVRLLAEVEERRRAEVAMRALLDANYDSVMLIGADGRIAAINMTGARSLGLTPAQAVGRDYFGAMTPDLADQRRELCRMASENRAPLRFMDEYGGRFYDTNLLPLFSAQGELTGLAVYSQDITARRLAERALSDSEAILDETQKIGAIGGWKYVPMTGEMLWTRQMFRLFDVGGEFRPSLPGMLSFMNREDSGSIARAVEDMSSGGPAFDLEVSLETATGRRVMARCVGEPVRVAGRLVQLNGIVQDITALKATEEALRLAKEEAVAASNAKSDFLARISHEIRTPMNAVIGMTRLCMQTSLTPRQRDYLEKVEGSSRYLMRIINDILDYSKIESGKMVLERVEFNLDELLSDVCNLFSEAASAKGVELILDMSCDVPQILEGDPLRLEQILVNLVGNAVKFTETGEIILRVEAMADESAPLSGQSGETSSVRLLFSVLDTGPGIPEDKLSRIFETFAQADESITRSHGGTGLGLSISRGLADMMGGWVWAENRPGGGSALFFNVRLGMVGGRGAPGLPEFLIGKRALVMLGNHAAREAVSLLLIRMGLGALEAQTPEQGLRMIGEDRAGFGLVLWEGGCGVRQAADELVRSGRPLPPIICLIRAGAEQASEDKGCGLCLRRPVSRLSLREALLDAFGISRIAYGSAAGGESCFVGAGGYDPVIFNDTSLLLVEDNPINRQVASEILEMAGARVTHAANGLEAVRLVEAAIDADPFDAVLMDIQMPVMDGFEAASRIRREHPALRLPIIALTAHAMRGQRERCLASGMNDFVSKPIEVEALLATLARWIRPKSGCDPRPMPLPQNQPPVEMPEKVPGLDVRQGVRRLLGHSDRYLDLLRAFARDFAGAAEDIRAALQAGDLEGAGRLAHTVKGVAGNISADGLRQAAQEIEAAVKADPVTDLGKDVDVFEARLSEVLTSIGTIGSEPGQPPVRESRSLSAPMRILLVDDSRLYRMVVGAMLQDFGHTVVMAENGLKAVEVLSAAESPTFDLIILDLVMPVMDGFATAAAIRRLERSTGQRPVTIVGFSALDDASGATERERARKMGMDDCIPKTVSEPELQEALARVMNARSEAMICAPPDGADAVTLARLFAELEEGLRGNDFRAEEVFRRLVEALGGIEGHPDLAVLGESIRRFEYRRALDGLHVLAAWAGTDVCVN